MWCALVADLDVLEVDAWAQGVVQETALERIVVQETVLERDAQLEAA